MRKTIVMFGVCLIALSGLAAAQAGATHPGYFPIEEMGVLARGDLEVDVNLEGAMLEVAAGAMEQQSSGFAEMVSQLERVRVQVGAPEGADAAAVTASFNAAVSRLETSGWKRILSVEEDEDAIGGFLEWGAGLEAEVFTCHELVLLKSTLKPTGAVYTALERLRLGGMSSEGGGGCG